MLYPLLLATLAGITIPIGAMLARFDMVHPSWTTPAARHGFLSFGGGVLIAAVALVLVPQGVEHVSPAVALFAFAAGGAVFYALDAFLARFGNFGQLMAMLLDFVPEAIALGALMALGESGLAIALMITLQNLPEGFNAYHGMDEPTRTRARLLLLVFAGLVVFGPLAAWFGQAVLAENTGLLGVILLFSAGGVTFLTVQDVIPESHLDTRRAPALGAVAGFALGLAGDLYLG
ncbi:divalent cation transporter [Marinicauda pacifica]|uniref:Divalent cation transporter n=1 Tax=Marinicauda pacifica TaxID=1133559 RepID=A0A4V3RZF3_9PROT|nr:divalent cation transporter [Marinicauda pacifica]TGY94069.1 divalent cation transporter [Marinicauda pacifica]GGE32599.1 divalent cation transporter [Marinicauda pacifica]